MISTPNISGLKFAMNEHGLSEAVLNEKMRLFLSYQLIKSEKDGHDRN